MLYIHDYQSVLEPAKLFYDAASKGQSEEAGEHLETFFKESNKDIVIKQGKQARVIDLAGNIIKKGDSVIEKFNPSLARMALQQAQCDIAVGQTLAYAEDAFTDEQYKQLQKNRLSANFTLNRMVGISDIDHRIKSTYPKTYKKRLAIIPCLIDGVQVKLMNLNDEIVSQTEKVFGEDLGLACVKNLKRMKKFQYLIRRIFTR